MAVGEDVEDIEDILLEPSQPRGPMPALSVGRRMVKMQAEDVGAAAAAAGAVPGTQSIWVKTFGCAHNVSDSEYMMGQLAAYGYRQVGGVWPG